MITLNIQNETGPFEGVISAIANSFGDTPSTKFYYDIKSKNNVKAGAISTVESIIFEIESLCDVFDKYEAKVYRTREITVLNQIFTRYIFFVIDDKMVLPNIVEDKKMS